MKKTFLLIGLDSSVIDFSAPGMPPGATAERLDAMVADVRNQFTEAGDRCDLCALQPEVSAEAPVTAQLTKAIYDCILIGGGLRQASFLPLLERIINSIHRHAPNAAIGFMDLPQDAVIAITRVLSEDFKKAMLLSPSASLTNG